MYTNIYDANKRTQLVLGFIEYIVLFCVILVTTIPDNVEDSMLKRLKDTFSALSRIYKIKK